MRRVTFVVVKLCGSPCVLDLDSMAVAPFCERRDAEELARRLEAGEVRPSLPVWFDLKPEKDFAPARR